MPIGISDDQREIAKAFGKWAASLDGIALVRAAEDDADGRLPGGDCGRGRDGAVLDRRRRRLAARPRGGGRVVRVSAAARTRCSAPPWRPPSSATWGTSGSHSCSAARWCTRPPEPRTPWSIDRRRGAPRRPGGADLRPAADPDLTPSYGALGRLADGEPVEVDPARVRALVVTLAAAEASGVARWCLDTAVEYAGVREQFGQKIGAFQAIKHLCAEMLETSEVVTAAAWDAARAHGESERGLRAGRHGRRACSPSTAPSRSRRAASRCSAGSASPSSTTPTSTCGVPWRCARCSPTSASYADALAGLAAAGHRRTPHVELGGLEEVRAEVRQRG